ncbi:PREDICTED: uncharacterized protein LOC105557456 [Vollenhovia emeryi]|uniref:uncharacterized protein LOC105557456 n=1 Tax=Vollenhovia emeryi TaxID=411798 RepID=UPI0005F39CB7|nr:PREDICTED: uncharacterized protein LOC105557456 [Vollenhovia emeryi]
MVLKVCQINANHCRASQDLMTQYALENKVGICCFAEPWRIPVDNPHWLSSSDSTAAILWNPDLTGPGSVVFHRSNNIVGARFGSVQVISIYISPNVNVGRFLEFIDRLSDAVVSARGPVVICGDFNSKSAYWGSSVDDRRGEILLGLADQLDLVLCNRGNEPTCVRPQGSSIVDLTWISAQSANKIKNWSVIRDVETLSDHRLITFSIHNRPVNIVHSASNSIKKLYPRWSLKGLDAELLSSTFELLSSGLDENQPPDCLADDVGKWISDACDVAATRVGTRPPKRAVYWWNEETATARRVCVAARRKYTRSRVTGNVDEEVDRAYRVAKRTLRKAIRISKANAWRELVLGVEEDMWGLPYKMVMGRLRRSSPALSETLSPEALEELMDSLFPEGETHSPEEIWRNWDGERFMAADNISVLEVFRAIKQDKKKSNPAPGPDGVGAAIWRRTADIASNRLARSLRPV